MSRRSTHAAMAVFILHFTSAFTLFHISIHTCSHQHSHLYRSTLTLVHIVFTLFHIFICTCSHQHSLFHINIPTCSHQHSIFALVHINIEHSHLFTSAFTFFHINTHTCSHQHSCMFSSRLNVHKQAHLSLGVFLSFIQLFSATAPFFQASIQHFCYGGGQSCKLWTQPRLAVFSVICMHDSSFSVHSTGVGTVPFGSPSWLHLFDNTRK